MNDKTFEKVYSYDNVMIKLASPEKIREWSFGEVVKPDTLNYRTHKPEKDGLFCEKIFGPEKDYECSCGKYKKKRFHNMVCDRCGVEITSSRVRRSRMGHIELVIPIAHIWFVKSAPSKIGTLLDMTIRNLEKIVYYNGYIVINPGNTDYEYMDVIEIDDYLEAEEKADDTFVAKTGSEAIYELLKSIDLKDEIEKIQAKIGIETSTLKKAKEISKLKLLNAFYESGNRPEWMIMEVLPVLPPTLRPIVALEGGKFAAADFNDLYRRVITRNNRLKYLLEINAPEVILKNEKRMLQEAVDALLDNARKTRPIKGRGGRELKSLTDQLKGKQGRFRQNLLGKRVDYSGRSVISVDPELKLSQCGLPKEMAIELFKPYIIERLEYYGEAEKTKTAKKILEKKQPQIWKILEEVMQDHPVLLNRAPTLHRLGIQAFQPVLTEDKAIKLHPMVCTPYNADFDGDQMAVYVPLSLEAQMEARMLMSPTKNLLLPSNGKLAMAANQDIVLGSYYLTMEREHLPIEEKELNKLKYFSSYDEVILYYDRQEAYYRDNKEEKYDFLHKWIKFFDKGNKYLTTIGRVIFNNIIPSQMPFQNKSFTKGDLNTLAMLIYEKVGQERTVKFLDDLKKLSFLYATKSGVTFSARDVLVPKEKEKILKKANQDVIQEAKKRPKKKIVIAYAQDSHSIGAANEAKKLGLVDPILVGDKEIILKVCKEEKVDPNSFEIVDVKGEIEAGKKAVELILEGKGDIIMKGLISSDNYMRALLNKEKGLLPNKGVLSHIIVVEAKNYHKLILASDTAVIPYPDLNQKVAIIKYLISLAHNLGIECPKVAVISAIEKVNPNMPCSIDAALLTMMNKRKQISGGIVDGPLSVDLSLDQESKDIKNIDSQVAADADCLLFPDIQAGNTFYKTATKLAGAKMAAVVVGTKVPAVLSSRGDTIETKLYSIALSTLMVK